MASILPLAKTINTSRYNLNPASFDIVNNSPYATWANSTISADTPKGVLGGMVAVISGTDWQASVGAGVTLTTAVNGRVTIKESAATYCAVLGLFSGNSEGNAFENAPAAASGIVPVYDAPGLFEVYVFETSASNSSSANGLLSTYYQGCPLFCSPYGLLTCERPSTISTGVASAAGVDMVIGYCVKVPTASDLMMGVKLISPRIS